jgi:hypothetical protein
MGRERPHAATDPAQVLPRIRIGDRRHHAREPASLPQVGAERVEQPGARAEEATVTSPDGIRPPANAFETDVDSQEGTDRSTTLRLAARLTDAAHVSVRAAGHPHGSSARVEPALVKAGPARAAP